MSTILDSLKKSSEKRDDINKNSIDNFSFGGNTKRGKSRSYVMLLLVFITAAIIYFGYQYINNDEKTKQLNTKVVVKPTADDKQITSNVGEIALADKPASVGVAKKEKPNSKDVKRRIKEINERKKNQKALQQLNKPQPVENTAVATVEGKNIAKNSNEEPILKLESPKGKIGELNPKPERKIKTQPQAKQEHLFVYQLPFSIRKDIPVLKLNIHVYEEASENRMAVINGVRFAIDDLIDDVVLVKDITRDGVLLEFNNRVFLLPK